MTRKEKIERYLKQEIGFVYDNLMSASEDASFRKYYRIKNQNASYIVMDAPPEKESCQRFIEVTNHLESISVNVPHIYHQDMEEGILVISDFGDSSYLDKLSINTADKLYKDAMAALFTMQTARTMDNLENYSSDLLSSEMNLFSQWLVGSFLGVSLSNEEKHKIQIVFDLLVENAMTQHQVFVHRDYHSRNLLFLEENNPGIIDYQDAVQGPITYDLVSLLKDCYIKWPAKKVNQWVVDYHQRLVGTGLESPADEFITQFHLMGVQRHLKASGIFARLCLRDNKPGYIKDIPRTLSYIVDLKEISPLRPLIDLIENVIYPACEKKGLKCTQ